MNVLVTGGGGFVGRRLVAQLLALGHGVRRLVRRDAGPSDVVWDFAGRFPGDLRDVDAVAHLAARVSFAAEWDEELFRVNTLATAHIAEWCRHRGIPIVYASTVSLHGDAPLAGRRTPLRPTSAYALSKYLGEELVRTAPRFRIVRLAGIYGADGPDHLALNVSLRRALREGQVPVLRGRGGLRNYVCVDDAATFLLREVLALAGSDGGNRAQADSGVRYAAGPETMALSDFLTTLADVLLPGRTPVFEDGPAIADRVVEGDRPDFPMTAFRDYVRALREDRAA